MHRVHHGRRNPNQPPHKKIMSVPIRIRRRQSGSAGAPGVLKSAELAFNEVDGILYYGKGADAQGNATQIVGIGGNASSSYADGVGTSAEFNTPWGIAVSGSGAGSFALVVRSVEADYSSCNASSTPTYAGRPL